jgi:hypothetical protein
VARSRVDLSADEIRGDQTLAKRSMYGPSTRRRAVRESTAPFQSKRRKFTPAWR